MLGTIGYLAPEYAETGQITDKADVYAFGVVLLELISGRKSIEHNRPKNQISLVEWVSCCILLWLSTCSLLITRVLGRLRSPVSIFLSWGSFNSFAQLPLD